VSVKSPVSCRLKLSMLRRLRNSARALPIGFVSSCLGNKLDR
jgi:hypothetical protein